MKQVYSNIEKCCISLYRLANQYMYTFVHLQIKQDHKALLKAKYCPRVAAGIMHTEKPLKNSCDLDLWPTTLKFNRVLEVVMYMCMQNFIKLSAAVHELSTVH